ncbi:hypothetical protein E2562_004599 [Oryza meyeriana var. granulata]|uniref:Reverse transcriptase Ty1/copia-type domain-containing protein n=1 Tax=Oryza meyeriana var. granulata TaxID=110450 RepID=A0A6G1F3J5_9ORYZ|nr:hypothetical protein E2562_004599 [Oryza meyeriana var. granulata]
MEAGTDFVVEYPAMELGARRFDADTKNAAGKVIKHKARLVAKGYVQQPGVDFDEVFAPMARIESVRLLLALAAQEGWPVHHMDVKSAFLNGELIEEVYVRQPPGFTVAGHEDKVLRLDKVLYSLRQAPRAWNAKLDETLVALGFSHSASEHAVYARGKGASRLLQCLDLPASSGSSLPLLSRAWLQHHHTPIIDHCHLLVHTLLSNHREFRHHQIHAGFTFSTVIVIGFVPRAKPPPLL